MGCRAQGVSVSAGGTLDSLNAFATPKSVTMAWRPVIIALSGLMSRWTEYRAPEPLAVLNSAQRPLGMFAAAVARSGSSLP